MSFAGVLIIAIEPEGFSLTLGLIYLLLAAVSSSGASILMKRIDPMPAMQLQAWVGFFSVLPLVGVAPIMVMWFGVGVAPNIAVVVIMTFFPMLVNTVAVVAVDGDAGREGAGPLGCRG